MIFTGRIIGPAYEGYHKVDFRPVNQMTSYHGAVFLNIMVSSPWTSKILQEGPACSPFFKFF